MSGTYRDLEVWQVSMDMAVRIYQLTKTFPREETYGLTSQVRRAAISVVSNIAEGKGRASDRELVQFLCHARGSLFEIETQLAIAQRLGYGTTEEYASLQSESARIGRMLNGLIRSVSPQDKRVAQDRSKIIESSALKPEARSR